VKSRLLESRAVGPLCALTLGAIAGVVDAHAQTADILFFVHRGEVLLSSAWSSTFSDPSLQAGPVLVALLAAIAKVGAFLGASQGLALSLGVQAGVAVLLAYVTGLVLADRPGRTRLVAQLLVVAVALGTGMVHRSYTDGHPAQVAIPLLWIVAGLCARRERPVRAGLLLGLSAGLETWGVLGAPLVLLARTRRHAVRALAAEAALVGALYLPFVLAGDFRMFDYGWPVVAGSPASLVLSVGSKFTWWMRAVQGAVALGAGAAVAVWLRRSMAAVWVVPLAVVTSRLVFEPTHNDWYLIAVETAALVAAADLFTGRLAAIRSRARPVEAG
jgi:hypothetical protein